MKTFKLATIPGDGIRIEVVAAHVEVLHAVAGCDGGFEFTVERMGSA